MHRFCLRDTVKEILFPSNITGNEKFKRMYELGPLKANKHTLRCFQITSIPKSNAANRLFQLYFFFRLFCHVSSAKKQTGLFAVLSAQLFHSCLEPAGKLICLSLWKSNLSLRFFIFEAADALTSDISAGWLNSAYQQGY